MCCIRTESIDKNGLTLHFAALKKYMRLKYYISSIGKRESVSHSLMFRCFSAFIEVESNYSYPLLKKTGHHE